MHLNRSILFGLTFLFYTTYSDAQLYQINDFSNLSVQVIDSLESRFQIDVDLYNDKLESLHYNEELTFVLQAGSCYIWKSDSYWVISRLDLLNDFYYYNLDYQNEIYFLPIDKIDTIIEYDAFHFLSKNKDGYLICSLESQDSYSWIPYFVFTEKKPLVFHQSIFGENSEQRYFVQSNKKSNTYELHKLSPEKVRAITGEVFELKERFIKEINADSILSTPDTWSKHILIKNKSKLQLIDYTTDSLILDDIQSYFLPRYKDTRSAFKYACLFYDKRGELLEHVDRAYNKNYVPELFYNGSTLLTYFVELEFSSYNLPYLKDINMLGLPSGNINSSGEGSEYFPYGFSLKTDTSYYILSFLGNLIKEVFKLNDTLAVYNVAPHYNLIFDAKNNQVVIDSIYDFRSIYANVLYVKTKNNYLYTTEGKLLENSAIPRSYNNIFLTEILYQNSVLSALHHSYFEIDFKNAINQINKDLDGQYWNSVLNYILFSIDSASIDTKLKLTDELISKYPNINELNYLQALLYLNLTDFEKCIQTVKKMELYEYDTQNCMRIAALKQILFSESKKMKNLFISDLFKVIAILENNSQDPYLLADLYVFLIKKDAIQNLKEINSCELIEKFDNLISKGLINKSELFTSDLNVLEQRRPRCR